MRTLRRFFLNYRRPVVSLTAIVSSLAGFFLVVLPLLRTSLDFWNKARTLEAETADLRTKSSILTNLDEDKLRRDLVSLLAAVPSDTSVATIFSTVEGAANETGVSVTDITLTGIGSVATVSAKARSLHPSGAQIVNFTVTVSGTGESIRRFLGTVGKVRRLLAVKSFDLTLSNPSQARMDMEAYYTPLPTQVGAVGAKISALSEEEQGVIGKIETLPLLGFITALPPAALGPAKADPFSP